MLVASAGDANFSLGQNSVPIEAKALKYWGLLVLKLDDRLFASSMREREVPGTESDKGEKHNNPCELNVVRKNLLLVSGSPSQE